MSGKPSQAVARRTGGDSRFDCRREDFLKGTLGNTLQDLWKEQQTQRWKGVFDGLEGEVGFSL